jgi:predicted O-methyltransferase YrrM
MSSAPSRRRTWAGPQPGALTPKKAALYRFFDLLSQSVLHVTILPGNLNMLLKQWIRKIPGLSRIFSERDQYRRQRDDFAAQVSQLRAENQDLREQLPNAVVHRRPYVEAGHFFSPIPSEQDLQEFESAFPARLTQPILAIDLRTDQQRSLLKTFGAYYAEMPFSEEAPGKHRFFLNNNAFNYMDGIVLYSMLRHIHPQRVIEIGCGYSSCATLDTNELFLNGAVECTFIEPYPQLLYSLVKKGDLARINLIPKRLQEVDLAIFSTLQANDILFIDSTHVSRVNSDVNYIFFEILPRLAPGVIVHIHDIYYPFEYPVEWHREGRVWTEGYLMRAFLEFNPSFQILFWGSYLNRFFQEELIKATPLGVKNAGGSIWLRKVGGDE